MTLTEFIIIANIAPIIVLIGVIIMVINKKSREPYNLPLGLLLGSWLVATIASIVSREFLKITPNYSIAISAILDLPLITLIYYRAIGKKLQTVTSIVWVVYVSFGILNLLFVQRSDINSYTFIFRSFVVICYALYYFYWLLKELPTTQLHLLPMFWINSAFIIYSSGNLFLYAFTSYLVNHLKSDLIHLWLLHNGLYIIEASMITFAIWLDLKNSKLRS